MVVPNRFPVDAASYHRMSSPVAVKSAIVAASQKTWSASPVGALGPPVIKLNVSIAKQDCVIASSILTCMIVLGSLVEKSRGLMIAPKLFSAS